MGTLRSTGLVMALLLAAAARLAGQPGSPPKGVASLFTLDLAGTALDEFPASVKALNGTMTVVDKNGQHMLRAASPSEFLITLPQSLPNDFTVLVDLIPKGCCNPEDFMLEGMPLRNRGDASVELTWHPEHIMAVGGGGEMYQSDMPADLAASTPGNLTQLVITFSGRTVKLYTNGRRMYTLDKLFVRGRVLRVWLGGQDEGLNAVYLAGLVVMGGVATPGVTAENTGQGGGGGSSSSSGVKRATSGPANTITKVGGGTPPPLITNLTAEIGPLADGACLTSWCPDWNGNGACVASWCPDWKGKDGACLTSWCPDWRPGMSARKVTWSWTPPPGVATTMATFDLVATDPATGRVTTTRLSANPARLSSGASIAVVEGIAIRICVGSQSDPSDPTKLAGPTCLDTQIPGGTASQSQALIGPTPTVMRMGPTVTQGSPGPVVQWTALNGATGYTVKRWLSSDLTCCNNASRTLAGPPWQDAALLASGTYIYEVTASLISGMPVSEQTQFTVMRPVSTSTPTLDGPLPVASSGASSTPVVSSPIAAQSGTPVRTASAPPPGSAAAAALAPTGKPPVNIAVTGTPVLARLNWGSGISGMRGVTYRVDRSLESDPACCTSQSATLTFPAWTDEGMQWPGTYVFQVTELYPDGTFGVATTRWVRPDPVNPSNFRAASVSAGFVALRWDAVPNASWYELSGPGLGYPTFAATSGAFNVRGLAPGTYTWRVGTFYSSPNAPAPVSGPASAFPSVTVPVP